MKEYRKEFSAIQTSRCEFVISLVHQKNPSKHQYRLHLQIDTLNQTLWGLSPKGMSLPSLLIQVVLFLLQMRLKRKQEVNQGLRIV